MQHLRATILPPQLARYPVGGPNPRTGLGDWTLTSQPVDHSGNPLTFTDLINACPAATGSGVNRACLAAKGITQQDLYQPMTRFWSLQAIETGTFLLAAVTLIAVSSWWTKHRIS